MELGMSNPAYLCRWLLASAALLLSSCQMATLAKPTPEPSVLVNSGATVNILVMGGGSSPKSNEISLEKNVLYFQRTLKELGYDPAIATILFANGLNGRATVRYLDEQRRERFKPPQIPYLKGPSTPKNLQRWFSQVVQQQPLRPIFFYFTGHGGHNEDFENNSLMLWGDRKFTVQELAEVLDQVPPKTPVVTVMAQCFSGSFANLIYEEGQPSQPVSASDRCGFFATVKELPSVGCTPEVDEADYEDYSSSFFAGLSSRRRTGERIPAADYNGDRRVSYAEAHAFAKLDDHSSDLPVSTSEVWLQRQLSESAKANILNQPIAKWVQVARPEQATVVRALVKIFGFNLNQSFTQNASRVGNPQPEDKQALLTRLKMELSNIGAEQKLRSTRNGNQISTLDRILKCEAGSLSKP